MWIVKALIRTLTYLKMKRQEYKLSIMKKFAVIFTLGVTISTLIRITKFFFEVLHENSEAWQSEHKFVIAWFISYTLTLLAEAWIFRPMEGSRMLAEVDELLDETLTEIGTI